MSVSIIKKITTFFFLFFFNVVVFQFPGDSAPLNESQHPLHSVFDTSRMEGYGRLRVPLARPNRSKFVPPAISVFNGSFKRTEDDGSIIIILIKRYSLTRVKLTALYKHLITKTTLTYISANKT